MARNFLYYGDNLDILRNYIRDESVDLIYLDPPFKSNQAYNVLFEEQNGSRSKAQIKVFEDTWRWDQGSAQAYVEIVEKGPEKVSKVMQAFRSFLGENDMMAYLSMMAPRLVELCRVLKPTGSIYLHCDPTASHYLKLLMDAVFGSERFLNEIIWSYYTRAMPTKWFARKHGVLLFYKKGEEEHIFNIDAVRVLYKPESLVQYNRIDEQGRRYKQQSEGKRTYLTEGGRPCPDVWPIQIPGSRDPERLGYPTQKPEALLERIIKASSNEGDIVLDPFCGCGTTIVVAQRLKRYWTGIDITHLAVTLIKHRLQDAFRDEVDYEIIGEPVSLPDAQALAQQDRFQFQWWALGLVGARPVEQKKGADRGIDGRLYFHDEAPGKKTKQVILQVKSGHVTSSNIRDLQGVLEREKAEIGVLISLRQPSRAMRQEAASTGFYQSPGWGTRHPRLQILTVEELLEGRTIDYPAPRTTDTTFKKALRATKDQGEQKELF